MFSMNSITILILVLVAFLLFAAYRSNQAHDAFRSSLDVQKNRNAVLERIALALEKLASR